MCYVSSTHPIHLSIHRPNLPTATNTATPEVQATSITDSLGNPIIGDSARVTRIIDGDTIDVGINGQVYRVRYIGMDTPERGRPFFQEATAANADLVSGQTVILVKDVSETDRYSRLLRYVYLQDGTLVNGELVRLGYAMASTYPPDVAMQHIFTELQRTAVESGVGLWSSQAAATAVPTIRATSPPQPTSPPTAPPQPTSPPPQPTEPPAPQPTEPPAPSGTVVIVGVNKRDEFVDISNQSGSDVELAGWVLVSEKGNQRCNLGGVIATGQTLRIWALASDAGQGGYNCGFGSPIWNNSEPDPAVLYNPAGQEVSRW
ncbi:MAG: thermonuclease family protein [Chloroflexota bacterium]